jgi:hypothetical protein
LLNIAVALPVWRSTSAMVISVAGSQIGLPATAASDSPERMEYRPVINAAREGVHPGSTRNCVSLRLSAAS